MFNSTNFIAPYISSDKRLILRDSNLNKVGGINVCQYQKVTTEGTLVWVNLSDLKIILEFSTVADAKQAVLNLELAIEALRPNCALGGGGLSVVTHDGSLTGLGTIGSPLSVVGGGESLLTFAQAQTAMAGSTLVPGAHYKITDRCDAGMIFLATTVNQFDTNGVGGFFNPDWHHTGTQSANMIGQWYATMSSPSIGQIAIYNNFSTGSRHYRNLTGAVGTAPSGDSTNWLLLAPSVANGYLEEWDFIIYEFTNDYLNQRQDTRMNIIMDSAYVGNGSFALFQWGNNSVIDNTADGESIINIGNNRGSIQGVRARGGASLDASFNSGNLALVNLNNASFLDMSQNTGELQELTLGAAVELLASTNAGLISQSTFAAGVVVTAFLNLGTTIQHCTFASQIALILDPAVSVNGGRLEQGYSNFQATLDFSTPPLTGTTLNIPSIYNYIGMFNIINSSAANIVDSYSNWPVHNGEVRFVMGSGHNALNFDHNGLKLSWSAGQAVCDYQEPHIILLSGASANAPDSITLKQEGTVFRRISFVQASGDNYPNSFHIDCNGGIADTYTCFNSNVVLLQHQQYTVRIDVANTGASTLQIGRFGIAYPIVKTFGYSPVVSGSLQANTAYVFTFDGTSFVRAGTVYVNNIESGATDSLLFSYKYQTIAGAMNAIDSGEGSIVIVEASPLPYQESITPKNGTKVVCELGVTIISNTFSFINDSLVTRAQFDFEGFADIQTAFDVVNITSDFATINVSCQSIECTGNIIHCNQGGSIINVYSVEDIVVSNPVSITDITGPGTTCRITTDGNIVDSLQGGFHSSASGTDNVSLIVTANQFISNSGLTPATLIAVGGYMEMNCDIISFNGLGDKAPSPIRSFGTGAIELVLNGKITDTSTGDNLVVMSTGKITFNKGISAITGVVAVGATLIFNELISIDSISGSGASHLILNDDLLGSAVNSAVVSISGTTVLVAKGNYIVATGGALGQNVIQTTGGTVRLELSDVKVITQDTSTNALDGDTPIIINSYGPLWSNGTLGLNASLNFGQAFIQDPSIINPYA